MNAQFRLKFGENLFTFLTLKPKQQVIVKLAAKHITIW